jgi:hypothetical protein
MSEPEIVLREAQPYVGIRAAVTHGIRDFADSAFPELFGWLFENGVAPAGPPFLRRGRAGSRQRPRSRGRPTRRPLPHRPPRGAL